MTGPEEMAQALELAAMWADPAQAPALVRDSRGLLARALLVRDRQLRELREAADEFANRDGSPAAQDRLIAALAASDPDKTGPADPARLKDDHPRSGPPAAPQEKGASGGASPTRGASPGRPDDISRHG